ncbi:LacI family DNA-binding transcriptional regulator [Micromonospora sp. U56]|nr:LacI family DNA-binding transcriptional regulator [Micromonospora sp. U56]
MRARLEDVAKLAGVSPKTVSNVVNGHPYVREQTRERVLQAMKELNYRANISARNLARGRTGVLALAVPKLGNPYFAELAGYIIEAAERRSWSVLIDETRGDPERERRVIEGFTPMRLDAVIISVQGLTATELATLQPSGPLVLLGEKIFDGPADHVAADNIAAAEALTRHLIETQRRRIAVIGLTGTPLRGTPDLRLDGYRRALREAGLTFRPEYVPAVSGYQRSDGARAMARLLELGDRPDAVVCFNDEMAVGALKTLAIRSIAVPEDIAVAGFDDIDESRYCHPSLTTVSWKNDQIAQVALDLLEERIRQQTPSPGWLPAQSPAPPREVMTDFELIVRGSTVVGADTLPSANGEA